MCISAIHELVNVSVILELVSVSVIHEVNISAIHALINERLRDLRVVERQRDP